MKVTRWFALLILSVPLALAGCGGGGKEKQKDLGGREYEVQGRVVAVAADKTSVTLDHEEIKGLMPAMKMDFKVADSKVLEGVKVGDLVHGHLRADSGRYVIYHLEKH